MPHTCISYKVIMSVMYVIDQIICKGNGIIIVIICFKISILLSLTRMTISDELASSVDMIAIFVFLLIFHNLPTQDSEALFSHDSDDEKTVSIPVVAILQEHKGIMYISLEIDPAPLVTVHNTCLFPLHIGQAKLNYKDAGMEDFVFVCMFVFVIVVFSSLML